MLNPEIAQARLKEYQVTDWQPVRLAKLAKLPAKLGSIGYGILAHDQAGNPVKIDYYNQSSIIDDNLNQLNGLKPTERLKIFAILIASAKGEHEIGAMGRHVVRSLLLANRPEGWEFVEKLLICCPASRRAAPIDFRERR